MFAGIPSGADLYVTSTVLRCFDDVDCVRILRNCAAAMPEDAWLTAFEQLVPPGPARHPWAASDLTTMTVYGGDIR